MKKSKILMGLGGAFLACVTFGLAGCATNTDGIRVTLDTRTGEGVVIADSQTTADRIEVVKLSYIEQKTGIKRAYLELASKVKRRQDVQVKMVWMDADGMEIDPDGETYRVSILDGKETITVTSVSPNPRAVKVKVNIREGRVAQ